MNETILFLSERDVARALDCIDAVEPVAAALEAHASGQTLNPAQAYLAWEHGDETARSLSMPSLIGDCPGVKIINANPANPGRGLPRASGLIVLFDVQTAQPICILGAARVSAVRTAAVTAIAADTLGAEPIERLALLGAGALARCHLELLRNRLSQLREIRLYDLDPVRARALAGDTSDARIIVCDAAEEAIRGSQLVVPVTTARDGYIRHEWLDTGALLVNVSLDDPLPEVVLRADKIFVDDWMHVAHDERRLLGRMRLAGRLRGPLDPPGDGRTVDGELGQVLAGICEGRTSSDEIILMNPFGLAIEDLAVADRIHRYALEHDLGISLPGTS